MILARTRYWRGTSRRVRCPPGGTGAETRARPRRAGLFPVRRRAARHSARRLRRDLAVRSQPRWISAGAVEDIPMNITPRTSVVAIGAVLLTLAVARAQEPGGRGRGAGGRGGAADQTPEVRQVPRTPVVDPAAHDRGRSLWAVHCIDCHGSQARGSETGPNIIRTKTVNFDRSSFTPGSVLVPFLKAGHPTQSGKASASFTDEEIGGLAHFLRQRVNDTMRGSAVFTAGDILVGDAKAGEAYFHGAGGCATCHNASTRSLAGIGARAGTTVDLQQRMLFPGAG